MKKKKLIKGLASAVEDLESILYDSSLVDVVKHIKKVQDNLSDIVSEVEDDKEEDEDEKDSSEKRTDE